MIPNAQPHGRMPLSTSSRKLYFAADRLATSWATVKLKIADANHRVAVGANDGLCAALALQVGLQGASRDAFEAETTGHG